MKSVSLAETIMAGLPRRSINTVRSRAICRPKFDMSGIAANRSRVRLTC
jgi:hypothetical protein